MCSCLCVTVCTTSCSNTSPLVGLIKSYCMTHWFRSHVDSAQPSPPARVFHVLFISYVGLSSGWRFLAQLLQHFFEPKNTQNSTSGKQQRGQPRSKSSELRPSSGSRAERRDKNMVLLLRRPCGGGPGLARTPGPPPALT